MRSEIIPSLPRSLFAPPESKASPFLWLGSWLRHLIRIGSIWQKADKVIKYLASFVYQIVSVSALMGLLSVFTCLSLYPHSCAFSWYRSYLLTWQPLSSLFSHQTYSIILEPEASLVAQGPVYSCTVLPPSPPPFTFWIPLTCISCPAQCPVTVLSLMVCILYSQRPPTLTLLWLHSNKQAICRNIQMCLTNVYATVLDPTLNDFSGIELWAAAFEKSWQHLWCVSLHS